MSTIIRVSLHRVFFSNYVGRFLSSCVFSSHYYRRISKHNDIRKIYVSTQLLLFLALPSHENFFFLILLFSKDVSRENISRLSETFSSSSMVVSVFCVEKKTFFDVVNYSCVHNDIHCHQSSSQVTLGEDRTH